MNLNTIAGSRRLLESAWSIQLIDALHSPTRSCELLVNLNSGSAFWRWYALWKGRHDVCGINASHHTGRQYTVEGYNPTFLAVTVAYMRYTVQEWDLARLSWL